MGRGAGWSHARSCRWCGAGVDRALKGHQHAHRKSDPLPQGVSTPSLDARPDPYWSRSSHGGVRVGGPEFNQMPTKARHGVGVVRLTKPQPAPGSISADASAGTMRCQRANDVRQEPSINSCSANTSILRSQHDANSSALHRVDDLLAHARLHHTQVRAMDQVSAPTGFQSGNDQPIRADLRRFPRSSAAGRRLELEPLGRS